jgi:hypothetical protein
MEKQSTPPNVPQMYVLICLGNATYEKDILIYRHVFLSNLIDLNFRLYTIYFCSILWKAICLWTHLIQPVLSKECEMSCSRKHNGLTLIGFEPTIVDNLRLGVQESL